MNDLHKRAYAEERAAEIVKDIPLPRADAPHMKAVIVEALLFEEPMKNVQIAVNGQQSTFYKITIKGYQGQIPLVKWVNTFLGQHKSQMLQLVSDTFVQINDKTPMLIIHMDKIEFHSAQSNSSASSSSGRAVGKMKKRTE
jgi:hypothetical protein